MNTNYTEKSKYYQRELAFRMTYPHAQIERHAANWQAATARDADVIDRVLLGFNKMGRNADRVWIVARTPLEDKLRDLLSPWTFERPILEETVKQIADTCYEMRLPLTTRQQRYVLIQQRLTKLIDIFIEAYRFGERAWYQAAQLPDDPYLPLENKPFPIHELKQIRKYIWN